MTSATGECRNTLFFIICNARNTDCGYNTIFLEYFIYRKKVHNINLYKNMKTHL